MADSDQVVGSIGLTQQWIETSTGKHARLVAAALVGQTTGNDEVLVTATTGGNVHMELQPSTEVIGLLGASTAVIGHIIADASTAKIGALQASTEAIGLVGGHNAFPQVTLVTTTSQAYSTGDSIGGSLTFDSCFRSTSVMSGILQSVVVADKSTAGQAALDLWLFRTATTGSTFTNDAAVTVADVDLSKVVTKVSVSSGDYYQFADNAVAVVGALGLPISATTGTSLQALVVCRSTAPSYASASDITISLGILQD